MTICGCDASILVARHMSLQDHLVHELLYRKKPKTSKRPEKLGAFCNDFLSLRFPSWETESDYPAAAIQG
jgi:phenolic acid decarboxylase